LMADVWQMPDQTGTNVVDVYVNYLRRKVDGEIGSASEHGTLIETVRGSGYRLGCAARKPPSRELGRKGTMTGVAFA
jgi:DNA-binding response OmpR family regulator